MNKYVKEMVSPFMDKAEVRIYELVGLVISVMMASIGLTFSLLYYGNEITALFGWKDFWPFAVSNVEGDTKITTLVMGVAGLVIYALLMQIVTGKKRYIKD